MKETVEKKAAKLESIGYSEYLKQMQVKIIIKNDSHKLKITKHVYHITTT